MWLLSQELISKKRLRGHLNIHKGLPKFLFLDEYRMAQLLFNLITNSIKFTDQGTISVSIKWLENKNLDSDEVFGPKPYEEDEEGIFEKEECVDWTNCSVITDKFPS